MPPDFRVSITDSKGKGAYPIASFTYILVYQGQADAAKGKALVNFLWWASHDGQKLAGPLDYAPLPAPVVKQIEAKLRQVVYQGRLLLAAR